METGPKEIRDKDTGISNENGCYVLIETLEELEVTTRTRFQ